MPEKKKSRPIFQNPSGIRRALGAALSLRPGRKPSRKRKIRSSLHFFSSAVTVAGAFCVGASKAKAASVEFAPNGFHAGNPSGTGGSGVWNSTTPAWWNGEELAAWTPGDTAVFAGTSGVAALEGPLSAGGLTFRSPSTTLTGGSLSLTATDTALPPLIAVQNTGFGTNQAILQSPVTGSQGLTKTGDGTLRLTEFSATGPLLIQSGTLVVENPGQIGPELSPVSISGVANSGNPGFSGGALLLAGNLSSVSGPGMNFTRSITASGRGPGAANGSGALVSLGYNTLSGGIALSSSGSVETRAISVYGTTQVSGPLFLGSGGAQVLMGNGNWVVSGQVTGSESAADRFIKSGNLVSSTLWLQNPANNFAQSIRIDSGTVRVSTGSVLGINSGPQAIDFLGGTLEVRTDNPNAFAAKNLFVRNSTAGALFLDHSLEGPLGIGALLQNQTVQFGQLSFFANSTFTFNSRNGWSAAFSGQNGILGGGQNGFSTLQNSGSGLLSLSGDLWGTRDRSEPRTFTLQSAGDTLVTGKIQATGSLHLFQKTGSGTLTFSQAVSGAPSTLSGRLILNDGTTEVRTGEIFGSSRIQLNGGALAFLGASGTGEGEDWNRNTLDLSGSNAYLLAQQSGSSPGPLRISSNFAASNPGTKTLHLGGDALGSVANQIAGLIPNSGSLTSLVKFGTGTWELAEPASGMGAPTTISLDAAGETDSTLVTLPVEDGTAGLVVGQPISGPGIPAGTLISQIVDGKTLVLSQNRTALAPAGAAEVHRASGMEGIQSTTAASTGTANPVLTLPSTAGLVPGQRVVSTSLPAEEGWFIRSISGPNSVTLASATGASKTVGAVPDAESLSFTPAPNFAGTLTLTAGTLRIRSGSVVGPTTPVIFDSDPVTRRGLAGGILEWTSGTADSASFGRLSALAGHGVLRIADGTGTLNFLGLAARSPGATLDFQPGSGSIQFSTPPNSGVLPGYATFRGTDWAALDGTRIVGFTGYTPGLPGSGAAAHSLLTGDTVTTAAQTVQSLKLAGAQTMTLGGALSFSSSPGGLLFDNSFGPASITGPFSVGTAGQELVITTNGSSPAQALTVSSPIGSGGSSLTKTGDGLLVLSGPNAYTGNTTVNQGTLRLSGAAATLGAISNPANTTVVRQNAVLDLNGAGSRLPVFPGGPSLPTVVTGTLSGAGTVTNLHPESGAALWIGQPGVTTASSTFGGTLADGTQSLHIVKNGTGTQAVVGMQSYTGGTVLNGGTLAVTRLADGGAPSGIGASSSAPENLVFNNGTLLYTGAGATGGGIYQTSQTPSVSTNRLFSLAGNAGIQSSGTFGNESATAGSGANHASLVFANTSPLVFLTPGSKTLTLGGSSAGDNVFRPLLTNNPLDGSTTGLTKADSGLWILQPATPNTYSGTTTVSGGALRALDGVGLPTNSLLSLQGGVLESAGLFSREPGTAPGQVQIPSGSSGFAAATPDRLRVRLGSAGLSWGTPTFNPGALVLGSGTALGETELLNDLALNAATRTLTVQPNFNTGTMVTAGILSGILSDGSVSSGITKNGAGVLTLGGANRYTGNTTIQDGTLVVSSIGNASGTTASSLGASGGSLVLSRNSGDLNALLYVGPGESATRPLSLEGNLGTADRTWRIDASGSGPLELAGAFSNTTQRDASLRTLFLELRGSNVDNNTVRSLLTDSSAATNPARLGINKTEGGTWILNPQSPNQFTGPIRVFSGTLGLTEAGIGSSPILSLNNGSIFGYGGPLTVRAVVEGNGSTAVFAGQNPITLAGTDGVALRKTAGPNSWILSNNLENGAALTIQGNFQNLESSTAPAAPQTLFVRGYGTTVWNGSITENPNPGGRIGLDVAVAASLTLSGPASTYTGPTTLSQGALILSKDPGSNPLGASSLFTLAGGTVSATTPLLGASAILTPVQLSGSPAVFEGSQSIELAATLTNSGGNRLLFNQIAQPASLLLSAPVAVNLSENNSARTLTLAGPGDTRISGSIQNGGTAPGNLVFSGSGRLTLSGDNTFSGSLTVNRGTVLLTGIEGGLRSLSSAPGTGLVLNSGGIFQLDATAPNRLEGRALTLQGGTFSALNPAPETPIALGHLRVGTGLGRILLPDSGALSFTSSDFPTAGSLLDLSGIAELGSRARVLLGSTPPTSAQGISPRILIGETDFAGYDPALGVVPFNAYASLTDVNSALRTDTLKLGTQFSNLQFSNGRTVNALALTASTPLEVSVTGDTPVLTLASGAVLASGGTAHRITAPQLHLGAHGIFQVGAQTTLEIAGSMVAGNSLSKALPGTLLLSGKQFLNAPTSILDGTLRLGAGNSTLFPGTSGLVLDAGATLDLNGTLQQFAGLSSPGLLPGTAGRITSSTGTGTLLAGNAEAVFAGSISGDAVHFVRTPGQNTTTFESPHSYGGSTTVLGGSLDLRDDAALLRTSSISIQYGRLQLQNNAGLFTQNDNRLPDTAPVTLRGADLRLNGRFNSASRETLGPVTLAEGANTLVAAAGGGAFWSTELSLARLDRSPGTTLNILGSNVGLAGNSSRILLQNPPTTQNGFLGAWAIVNSTDYAAFNPATGIGTVGQGGYVPYDAVFGPGRLTQIPATAPSVTTLPSGTTSAAVLRLAGAFQNDVAFANAGDTLNLELGGLLRSDNNAPSSLGSPAVPGVLTAGGAESSGLRELVVYGNQSTLTVHAQIADNGSGNRVQLIKSGANTLVLTAANSFSGGTVVNQGTLQLSPAIAGASVLPAGLLTLNGGANFTAATVNVQASNAIAPGSAVLLNGRAVLNLAANTAHSLDSLQFNNRGGDASPTVSLGSGTTLTLTGVAPLSAVSQNPLFVATVSGGTLLLPNGATPVFTAPVSLQASGAVFNEFAPSLHLASTLASAPNASNSSLTKTGTGLLLLSGANTFTNGVQVLEGGLVLGRDTATSLSAGLLSGPLGTGTAAFAPNTRLLVNNASRVLLNPVVFAADPLIESTGLSPATLQLTGTVTFQNLQTTGTQILLPNPSVSLALRGTLSGIESITALGFGSGPGSLRVSGPGNLSAFNFTQLNPAVPVQISGLTSAPTFSLLHDGDGTGAPQILPLGNLSWAAPSDALLTLTVDRAGATSYFATAANKTLAPASLSTPALANGLTLVNNNGFGLRLSDNIALAASPTFSVANASASNVVQGLTLTGRLSGASSLVKTGAGTLVLANPLNTFNGPIQITRGVLAADSDAALGNAANPVLLAPSAGTSAFRATSSFETARSFVLANTANTRAIEVVSGSVLRLNSPFAFSGDSSASLAKNDTGILSLAADNSTWSGTLTVNGGAVRALHNAAFGTGTVQVASSQQAAVQLDGGVSVANPLVLNSGTASLPLGGIQFGGQLENVSGDNTWSGPITTLGDAAIGSTSGTLTLSGGLQMGSATPRALFFTGAGNIRITGTPLSAGAAPAWNRAEKFGSGSLQIENVSVLPLAGDSFKINAGRLLLSGEGALTITPPPPPAVAPSFSGFQLFQGATLELDNSSTTVTNRLGASSVQFRGGHFLLRGGSSGPTSETISNPLFTRGYTVVTVQADPTQPAALLFSMGATAAAFASANNAAYSNAGATGASVLFRGSQLGSTAGPGVASIAGTDAGFAYTGQSGPVGSRNKGILPWALVDRTESGSGVSFATSDGVSGQTGAFGLRPLAASEYEAPNVASSNSNLLLNSGFTSAGAANLTVNSLTLESGAQLGLGTRLALTNSSGGILVRNGASSISGGILSQPAGQGVLNFWTLGDLTVSSLLHGGNGTRAGNISLVKAGSGTLTLATPASAIPFLSGMSANTLTGQYVLNQGTLRLQGGTNTLPANNYLALNGGTLDLNGNIQFTSGLFSDSVVTGGLITSSSGPATLVLNNDTASRTFAGTSSGPLFFARTGDGALTFTNALAHTDGSLFNGGTTTFTDAGRISGTGPVSVQHATILFRNDGTTVFEDRLPDSVPVSLLAGTLQFVGRPQMDSRENAGPLSLVAGQNNVFAATPGTGVNSLDVTFADLSRPVGSTALVRFNDQGSKGLIGSRARTFFTRINGTLTAGSTPVLRQNLIGPWAFVDREFASYQPGFGVGPINGQGFAGSSSTPLNAFPASTENIRSAVSGTTLLGGNTVLNTLTFASPTANSLLDLGGFTLRSEAGGILFAQSTNNTSLQIANGSLTAGAPGVPADFYLIHANYGGVNRTVRISANLTDNGPGGSVRVVKSSGDTGASVMTWASPANSYTGGTVVSLGTLVLDGPGVTIPAAADSRRGLQIYGPATVTMLNRPGQIAASNVVSLIGNATLNLHGDNTLEGLVFDNAGGGFATPLVNTFGLLPESGPGAPGVLTIGNAGITASSSNPSFTTQLGAATSAGIAGRVQFGDSQKTLTIHPILVDGRSVAPLVPTFHLQGVVGSPAGFLKAGDGLLQLSAPQIFTGPLTVAAGGIALGSQNAGSRFSTLDLGTNTILNLAGYSTTLGGLAGSGDVFSDRGAGTLSIGFNNADSVFSGQFRRFNDALPGGVSLAKVGSGTLTLSSPQSSATASTGTVSVHAGTLAFSGAGAWFQGTPATPSAGALSGAFVINSGGTLLLDNTVSPLDNRLGLRDTGSLTLQGGELRLTDGAAGSVSEQASVLTFQNGAGTVTLLPHAATSLSIATLTTAGNSSAGLFRGISAEAGLGRATLSIATPNLPANQGTGLNGSKTLPIRPDLLGDASPTGLGTGFLVRDSSTSFWRPLALAETETSPALWGDNVNASVGSTSAILSAATQANSLTLSGTVNIASGLDPAFFGRFGGGSGLLGLRLSDAAAVLALDDTSATLDLGSLTTASGNTGYTHVLGNASLTLNGYLGIGSTGGWNKSGSGTFRLNQRALYTGATTLNGGTLELNSGSENTLAVVPGPTVPTLTALQINGASTVLDLMGRDQAVASLQNNAGANPLPGAGGFIRNSGAYAVFTSTGGGTFAGVLGGNLGFTRAGNNTTLLTAPQTYIGPTVIRGGALQLRDSGSLLQSSSVSVFGGSLVLDSNGLNPAGTPNLQRISATAPVQIRGSLIQTVGTGSADVTTELGSLTVLGGSNTLAATPLINAGSTVTITVNDLVRSTPHSMLSFQGWAGSVSGNAYNVETLGGQGLSRASRIFVRNLDSTPFSQARLSNNLIGGWAVADGNSFATYRDGIGVMVMGSTVQGIAAPAFDGTDISGAVLPTHNISDTTTTRTLASSRSVNSLRLAASSAQTITLGSGASLALNVGLITNSAAGASITGTDATSTLSGPDNGLLYIWVNQQPLSLLTVLSGSSGLVKGGGGNLTLNPVGGSNTYSGPTFFLGGTVTLNGDAGEVLIPGNLTIENTAVTLGSLNPGQIAASSSVAIHAGGSLTLTNYNTSVTQSLARLSFSNSGGNANPTLSFGTPTGTGTVSTLVLTAADAITASNDSLATTPLLSTGEATRTGLQFAHPDAVIHTSGISTHGLDIQAPITAAAGMLTKSGPGSLTLRGASTFQTGLRLSAGSLIVGANSTSTTGTVTAGPVGTGTLTVEDGTALLSDGTARTIANPVTVNGNFSFSGVTAGNSLTLSGPVQLGNTTRTIHVSSPAVTGALSGALTSSAPGDAILKTGPGTLTLGSSLSAGFGVQVAEGNLRLTSATSLPTRVNLATGSALDLNGLTLASPAFLSGTGFLTNSNAAAATLVLGGSSVSDVSSNTSLSFDFPLADSLGSLLHLTKSGLGTLTLNRANANFGNFTVVGGTLRAGNAQVFSPNGTVILGSSATGARTVTLDTGGTSQTVGGLQAAVSSAGADAQILLANGSTLTVSGPAGFSAFMGSSNATSRLQFPTPGGNLVVSHPSANFLLNGFSSAAGATGTHQVDFSGLASLTASVARFAVGEGNSNLTLNSKLTLATANQITAASGLFVGRSQNGAGGTTATLELGQSNSLFVGATGLAIGTDKASGTLQFKAGLSNPTLLLRGTAGLNARTDFSIGTQDNPNTTTTLTGQVLLTEGAGRSAGSIDALLGALRIGEGPRAGTGSGTGLLEFDRGAIDATSVLIGSNASGAGSGSGTLKIGGGSLSVGAGGLLLASKPAGSGNASGSLLISGGTVSIQGTGIRAGGAGSGTSTSLLSLDGGSLDLNGTPIGSASAPVTQLQFLSGSLRNLAELNGGAPLRKTGAGTLELGGNNSFTGQTLVTSGSLLVSSSQALGSPLGGTEVAPGAALILSKDVQIPLESLTLAGSGPGGSGALRNLSGSNTFAGPVTLSADSRIQSDAGRLTLSSLQPVSGSSATLTLSGIGQTAISSDLNIAALSKEDSGIAFLNGNQGPSSLLQVLGGDVMIEGSVNNTPSLSVHSGGSLLLAGTRDRISDSAALSLGSATGTGRFGFTAGLNNASETVGTLTLQANSILDFGSGSGNTLTFSSISLGSAFLDVYNWSGSVYRTPIPDTGDPAQDRFLFSGASTGLSPAQFTQIRFFSDAGQTFLGTAGQIQFGSRLELVPIPEPGSWAAGSLLLGLLGFRERKRLRRACRRPASKEQKG